MWFDTTRFSWIKVLKEVSDPRDLSWSKAFTAKDLLDFRVSNEWGFSPFIPNLRHLSPFRMCGWFLSKTSCTTFAQLFVYLCPGDETKALLGINMGWKCSKINRQRRITNLKTEEREREKRQKRERRFASERKWGKASSWQEWTARFLNCVSLLHTSVFWTFFLSYFDFGFLFLKYFLPPSFLCVCDSWHITTIAFG